MKNVPTIPTIELPILVYSESKEKKNINSRSSLPTGLGTVVTTERLSTYNGEQREEKKYIYIIVDMKKTKRKEIPY